MKMLLGRRYLMNGLLEKDAARNSLLLLVLGLCAAFAPAAFGQSAAGAATAASGAGAAPVQTQSAAAAKPGTATVQNTSQTSAQTAAQAPAQASAQTAAQAEPKMEDQSAPAAESLGEAARRARAQKAKTAGTKVYSDDAVSNLSGHGVSVVGDGQAGGGASSYSGGGGAANGGGAQGAAGSQESYWRGRANAIRAQMAQCDQKISEIQDEIAKHGAVSVDPMSGAQAGVIFVEDRNAQIKQVEHQKEGLQSQLDELAEEGRKAGADSGWFR
jgi:hypothetical protein